MSSARNSAAQGDVEYLGILCIALVIRKPVPPYYVLSITDECVSFTGIINMSSLADTAETVGLYVTHLPKYVLLNNAALRQTDAELSAEFMAGFGRIYSDSPEPGTTGVHFNSAVKMQPLRVLGYSGLMQAPRTRQAKFNVVNTAQFASSTLNNNEAIRTVSAFLAQIKPDLRSAA